MFRFMGYDAAIEANETAGVREASGRWSPQRRPRLCDAVALGGLTALCRCGARSDVDPRIWLEAGLGGLRLAVLEDRLRCGCGERRATLVCGAPSGAPGIGPAIHVFR